MLVLANFRFPFDSKNCQKNFSVKHFDISPALEISLQVVQSDPDLARIAYDCVEVIDRDLQNQKETLPGSLIRNFKHLQRCEVPIVIESVEELLDIASMPYFLDFDLVLAPSLIGREEDSYAQGLHLIKNFVERLINTPKPVLRMRFSVDRMEKGFFKNLTRTLGEYIEFRPKDFAYDHGNLYCIQLMTDLETGAIIDFIWILRLLNSIGALPILSILNDFLPKGVDRFYRELKDLQSVTQLRLGEVHSANQFFFCLRATSEIPNLIVLAPFAKEYMGTIEFIRKGYYFALSRLTLGVASYIQSIVPTSKQVSLTIPFDPRILRDVITVFPQAQVLGVEDLVGSLEISSLIELLDSILQVVSTVTLQIYTNRPEAYHDLLDRYPQRVLLATL